MGWRSRLNQWQKKQELEKNPHLARREDARKKLEDFYRQHPYGAPHIKEKVDKLRKQCVADIEMLSKKADEDITRTEAIFIEKELELVSGYGPEEVKPSPFSKWLSALSVLFARRK